MQQTFEFSDVAHNGFIKIPDEYVHQVGSRIRIVLYTDDKSQKDITPKKSSLLDLAGIFKGCANMDVKKARIVKILCIISYIIYTIFIWMSSLPRKAIAAWRTALLPSAYLLA